MLGLVFYGLKFLPGRVYAGFFIHFAQKKLVFRLLLAMALRRITVLLQTRLF